MGGLPALACGHARYAVDGGSRFDPGRSMTGRGKQFAKIGATALRIYANHMLSFTAGAIAGAVTAFITLMPYIVAASR